MKTMSAACAALVMLAACGGGSMSGSGGSTLAASAQSVATSGTITAFGSVFVNGVRYDVSAASIRKNGRNVAQAALAVGEVAMVHGHQDLESGQGSANSVEVEDNVVGPIAALDSVANTLTVLGQTINVTASTSFAKDISPADLGGLKVVVSPMPAAPSSPPASAAPRPASRCRCWARSPAPMPARIPFSSTA